MDSIKYFSSVKPELKKRVLLIGSLWAAAGTLPLILFGIFSSVKLLSIWGLPILGFWILCLLAGMIPYRKMTKLENSPNSLMVDVEKLVYFRNKKALFSIPLESIEDLRYFETKSLYGIGVELKHPLPRPVIVNGKQSEIVKYYDQNGYDLFFPFFTESACESLKENLLDV